MQGYKLKSGYVTVDADATDLDAAMKEADEWCSYSKSSLEILHGEDVVASRSWCGCLDGIEDQSSPIQFGDFGYYADWLVQ